jgi:hypothetical protein
MRMPLFKRSIEFLIASLGDAQRLDSHDDCKVLMTAAQNDSRLVTRNVPADREGKSFLKV